jgi:hypothetical protein
MLDQFCAECGAIQGADFTCQDHFHQMLYWEAEFPAYGTVHHLMVLCYHLQHPSLYSPDGLKWGQHLLTEFVVNGVSTEEIRRRNRDVLDSGQRAYKIKGSSTSRGAYEQPPTWTMTAADVVTHGAENYINSVEIWARSVVDALVDG